jgi:hypothetical protein
VMVEMAASSSRWRVAAALAASADRLSAAGVFSVILAGIRNLFELLKAWVNPLAERNTRSLAAGQSF